ncbi:MAG: DUF167 domain-containing protein [Burkholderiales bacterium]
MKTLRIKVKPNARASEMIEQIDGTWSAQVKSAPVDGKANDELVALVVRHFKLRKSQVTIKSGASARLKTINIED